LAQDQPFRALKLKLSLLCPAMRAALLLSLFLSVAALRRHGKASSAAFFHRRRRTAAPYVSKSWSEHFKQYTADLETTSCPDGITPKCRSYIKEPRGTSRGLVLLQHGFTSCPGFFYMLAPKLLEQGWTVMVPSLPGHGRAPRIQANGTVSGKRTYTLEDYSSDMPEDSDGYENHAKELIEVGQKYRKANPGKETVLVGVSHGATVAMYMAMNGEAGTWDRVLLMNPFMAPDSSLGADYGLSVLRKLLPRALPIFQFFGHSGVWWGQECDERRWPGNAGGGNTGGVCKFDLKHIRAILLFGNLVEGEARARAAKLGVFTGGLIDRMLGVGQLLTHKAWSLGRKNDQPPSNLKVQLLATSNDLYVSNARIHFAAKALEKSTMGHQAGYCVLDKDFDHTYINPIDKQVNGAMPYDMWWMEPKRVAGGRSILDLLTGFMSEGELFRVSGTVQDDKWLKGDPRCAVRKSR